MLAYLLLSCRFTNDHPIINKIPIASSSGKFQPPYEIFIRNSSFGQANLDPNRTISPPIAPGHRANCATALPSEPRATCGQPYASAAVGASLRGKAICR